MSLTCRRSRITRQYVRIVQPQRHHEYVLYAEAWSRLLERPARISALDRPMSHFVCPVCGYPNLDEAPRSPSNGGSYEICPSCGFEFGVSDDDLGFTYAEWRQRWIDFGMKWGWDPVRQLRDAGLGG